MAGRITLEGAGPIHVGLVEYVPIDGGPSARSRIERGGSYQLSTYGENDGALAGEYVVLVSQPQLLVGSMRPAPEGHADEHHDGESSAAALVHPGYARRAASTLRAIVEPGENRVDLTLSVDGP